MIAFVEGPIGFVAGHDAIGSGVGGRARATFDARR